MNQNITLLLGQKINKGKSDDKDKGTRARSSYVAYYIWDDLKDARSSNPDNWSLANLVLQRNLCIRLKLIIKISGLSCLRLLWVLVFPEKGRCIDTRNHDQQCSDWLAAIQQRNDIISLKKNTWRKSWHFWTFTRKQPSEQNYINVIIDKWNVHCF